MVKVFIKKGILTICMNLVILLVGFYTLPYLSKEFIPSVEVPAVAVVFPAPLIDNKKLIADLVRPIENALSKTGDLESIETHIEDEKAVMILFYKWKFSPENCLQKARQVIENISRPKEVLSPIFILHRPTSSPILRTAIYGDNIHEITTFSRQLKREIERIPGVSNVILSGEQEKRVVINLSPNSLSRHNVKISDILKTSRESWSFKKYFRSDIIPQNILLNIDTKEKLGRLPVNSGDKSSPTLLRWLGEIVDEDPNPTVIYGKNRHALILEVVKAPGADTISVNKQAIQIIKSKGDRFGTKTIYDEAQKISESQNGVFQNFMIGVILNSLILVSFLGSSIGALVASVVFPTSLLGTLFIQKTLGISINLFSLNGFSLAVGMITDASTVVLESITRRFQSGEEIYSACWRGTKDVSLGVLASTLTTAGVLIPIAMQKNISSKLFSDLSLTVVSTQLLCLIAVFSLVPWLCFKIFKKDAKQSRPIEVSYRYSSMFVSTMVKFAHKVQLLARTSKYHRVLIPSSVVVFSIGMLVFLPKTEFLPAISAPVYSVTYPIKKSKPTSQIKELRNNFANTLGNAKGVLWSVATSTNDRIELLFELQMMKKKQDVLLLFKDLKIDHKRINIQMVGPAGSGEKFGYDGIFYLSKLIQNDKREALKRSFCSSPTIDYCQDSRFSELIKAKLTPNSMLSAQMGGSIIEAALDLAAPLREVDLTTIGQLLFPSPVIMKLESDGLYTTSPIYMPNGAIVSIGNLLPAQIESFISSELRYNKMDYSPLYFRMKDTTLGEVTSLMSSSLRTAGIKESQVMGMGGIQTMDDSFKSLIEALIISAIIIFAILAIQFQSWAQALIIMGTIPLTLGGAILGLLIMGETVNASVMVGFILLIGIVVNNGIFLIEASNQHLREGDQVDEAITHAVSERTRPILMTSLSTIFGMLPTILIGGEGSELYRGMAIVNVFGMVIGTILSIVITPIFIEIFGRKK